MGLRKSLRYLSLIVFMLLLMPEHWAAAAADESDELVPRLGETTAEFEARVKGLPRPPLGRSNGSARPGNFAEVSRSDTRPRRRPRQQESSEASPG